MEVLVKNLGFTLAEVLITLGIIGVVAALTLPTLIKKYQQHVTITQLKKAYSELNQAIKFSEAEYGDIENWDWEQNSLDFFNQYFSRYIKIKESKLNNQNITYYNISGTPQTSLGVMAHKDNSYAITTNSGYQIILNNRDINYYAGLYYGNLCLYIDINGIKKPNTLGKDVFTFYIIKNSKKLLPASWDDGKNENPITDRNVLKNGPSSFNYQCNKNGIGLWCGALIMQDGWKIAPDYPW